MACLVQPEATRDSAEQVDPPIFTGRRGVLLLRVQVREPLRVHAQVAVGVGRQEQHRTCVMRVRAKAGAGASRLVLGLVLVLVLGLGLGLGLGLQGCRGLKGSSRRRWSGHRTRSSCAPRRG